VTPEDYVVVENVANTDFFFFNGRPRSENRFRFLHVSNFNYQKNAEAIMESFFSLLKDFPVAELVLVGSIPGEIRQRIENSGLLEKNIFIKGEVSYPEVAIQMQEADALVMFSRYENSPCTIIESLCCGLPVVASRVGGIPELIDDSNGRLLASTDNEGLVTAMGWVIKNYSLFDRAAISARAMKRFGYAVVGKKLDEIYSGLLKEKA